MEQVRIGIPGGGYLTALRLQDLPADLVIAFMGQPPGYKEFMARRMLILASGEAGEAILDGLTYGELEEVLSEWMILSAESEGEPGAGLDWSGLWS